MRDYLKLVWAGLLVCCLVVSSASAQVRYQIPSDVKESVNQRVDRGQNVGIIIGIVGPNTVEYYSYGRTVAGGLETPDEHSVFEIGSISKVFTGILLAENVVGGEMQLDDPLQLYVPEGVSIPTYEDEPITLQHLSSHQSSLPRLPDNMSPADPTNPYADYTVDQMYAFLSGHELRRAVGSEYEYSNLAVGLLGHVLALHDGQSFEEILDRRIFSPLRMASTAITFSEDMLSRLARGHNLGKPVSNWDIPTLAGAGAIRSTARDMLQFLAANMDLLDTPDEFRLDSNPLIEAMTLSHEQVANTPSFGGAVGLGWHMRTSGDIETIWHNGGTGGYRTFAGFNRGGDLGVVVLSNSTASVDDIGFHILDEKFRLQKIKYSAALLIREAIDDRGVDAAWDSFHEIQEMPASDYNFDEAAINEMGYEYLNNGNVAASLAVFQMNVDKFSDSSNTYDSLGEAYLANGDTALSIINYQKSLELNPGNTNAEDFLLRLGVEVAGQVYSVSTEILASYVGDYILAPNFVLSITLEGDQLKAQATGQSIQDIFPSAETEFYWKVVNAQLTFNLDESGAVVGVTLHQGGAEVEGERVK